MWVRKWKLKCRKWKWKCKITYNTTIKSAEKAVSLENTVDDLLQCVDVSCNLLGENDKLVSGLDVMI